jgi:hypothetical protein
VVVATGDGEIPDNTSAGTSLELAGNMFIIGPHTFSTLFYLIFFGQTSYIIRIARSLLRALRDPDSRLRHGSVALSSNFKSSESCKFFHSSFKVISNAWASTAFTFKGTDVSKKPGPRMQ